MVKIAAIEFFNEKGAVLSFVKLDTNFTCSIINSSCEILYCDQKPSNPKL